MPRFLSKSLGFLKLESASSPVADGWARTQPAVAGQRGAVWDTNGHCPILTILLLFHAGILVATFVARGRDL